MLNVQLDHLRAKMPGGRPLMTWGQHPVSTRNHPGCVGQFEIGPTPRIEATQGSGRLPEPGAKRALGVCPGDVRSRFRGMTQLGMFPMDLDRRAVRQQIGGNGQDGTKPWSSPVHRGGHRYQAREPPRIGSPQHCQQHGAAHRVGYEHGTDQA